jgi:uncharacterized DUF497 family protein
MLDLTLVEGFEWDDGNARKSLDKHAVSQAEAEQVFALEPLLAEDFWHSQEEKRFQALGETIEGRRLHVTFTMRSSGRKIRVISARDMNRKERAIYEKES